MPSCPRARPFPLTTRSDYASADRLNRATPTKYGQSRVHDLPLEWLDSLRTSDNPTCTQPDTQHVFPGHGKRG
mgnify:CR=1 FL=1